MGRPRIMVVVASDSAFFPLVRSLLGTIGPFLSRPNVGLGFLDLGLVESDRAWLSRHTDRIVPPGAHFGLNASAHSAQLRSFTARPFLPDYFPGHDVYLWVDADIWLQDVAALDAFVTGAATHGLAVAHESERGYRLYPWLSGWTLKHLVLGFGVTDGVYLWSRPHLNAGLFAMAARAPHWTEWRDCYAAAIRRSGALIPHDQMSLNQVVHGGLRRSSRSPRPRLLDSGHNWIVDRGTPMWNDATQRFCKPYAPFETIGVLHLAGPAKRTALRVRRTGGGEFTTFVLPGATPDTAIGAWPSYDRLEIASRSIA